MRKNLTLGEKYPKCKASVMRQLRNNLKKDWKKSGKSVGKAEKGSTFAPATAKNALRHSGSLIIFWGKRFSKKRLEKACGKRKSFLHLHPAKHGKFLGYWKKSWKAEAIRKLQNFFKFFLRETKRSFSFAPALRNKRKQKKTRS